MSQERITERNPKGAGRKPGIPNRLTTTVKETIEIVAEGLGGAKRVLAWCKESPDNERIFWEKIWPKLLPLHVNHDAVGEFAEFLKQLDKHNQDMPRLPSMLPPPDIVSPDIHVN